MMAPGATRAASRKSSIGSSLWCSTTTNTTASNPASSKGIRCPSKATTGMYVVGRTNTSMPVISRSSRSCINRAATAPSPQPTSSTRAFGGMTDASRAASVRTRRPWTAREWRRPTRLTGQSVEAEALPRARHPARYARTVESGEGDDAPLTRRVTVSVVLPCFNEADSVGLCVKEARDALAGAGIVGEVVVVDNGSADGSGEVAEAAGARVVHEGRRGYGSALRAGFAAAEGDVIVMADADSTYDLTKVPDLVAPIQRDAADLVLGGRLDAATRRTMPFLHRFVGTPALTFLVARACGGKVVNDSQSGFRAFRRDKLASLDVRSTGMELASEMLIRAARAGLRVMEVPAGYRERIGQSKLNAFEIGRAHV